jgi:AcrR family transcriptional regulator
MTAAIGRKPPANAPRKERVANPVRSARTREKLMRATIECLYELGYDRTSTARSTCGWGRPTPSTWMARRAC